MQRDLPLASSFDRHRLARFFAGISRDSVSGCWIYPRVNYKGYGVFGGRSAHRWTYAWFVEPLAAGFEIDHLCLNTSCVNARCAQPAGWSS